MVVERQYVDIALEELHQADARMQQAQHKLGEFRVKFLRCEVFDRDALRREQILVEDEFTAAGEAKQAALQRWAQAKGIST